MNGRAGYAGSLDRAELSVDVHPKPILALRASNDPTLLSRFK